MCSEPDFSLHLFSFAGAVFAVRKRRYITTMRTAYLYLLFLSLFATGCTSSTRQTDKEQLYVSILPLRSLVEQIVGDDFKVDVLVPAGASPESFEPTPRQYVALNRSKLVFNVGLIDFEQNLLRDFPDREKLVNLSRGIRLLEGSCAHGHTHEPTGKARASEGHAHGIDPHIWTSPRALKQMAANAYDALRTSFPDSVRYTENYEKLLGPPRLARYGLCRSAAAGGRTHDRDLPPRPHLLCGGLRTGTARRRTRRKGAVGPSPGAADRGGTQEKGTARLLSGAIPRVDGQSHRRRYRRPQREDRSAA